MLQIVLIPTSNSIMHAFSVLNTAKHARLPLIYALSVNKDISLLRNTLVFLIVKPKDSIEQDHILTDSIQTLTTVPAVLTTVCSAQVLITVLIFNLVTSPLNPVL